MDISPAALRVALALYEYTSAFLVALVGNAPTSSVLQTDAFTMYATEPWRGYKVTLSASLVWNQFTALQLPTYQKTSPFVLRGTSE